MEHRLYLFDPSGHLGSALELRCADDAEALRLLRSHAAWRPILELGSTDRAAARRTAYA